MNLRGQRRLRRFGLLLVTVSASLALMVTAGNLATLALGWTVSGFALAGLISHTDTRPARRAARTVMTQMTLASVAIWSAVAVGAQAGLSLDGNDTTSELASGSVLIAALLLVAACVVRSALAPAHRWLPVTAEAPSPISALLHAGIVNAAGIVAVLQWPLLAAHPSLLVGLGALGLLTALVCTVEQRVRPDVKGKLAASTSAQMGWMALQVGIGAPAAAVLHLMGHGAWKAWLFLRAGGAVVRSRREALVRHAPRTGERLTIGGAALVPVMAVTAWLGATEAGTWQAGTLLLVGIALLIAVTVGHEAAFLERARPVTRGMAALIGGSVTGLYVVGAAAWEHSVGSGTETFLPSTRAMTGLALLALGGVIALAVFAPRLRTQSTHPIASLVSATSLPPRSRLSRRAPRAISAEDSTAPSPSADDVRALVETAAKLVGPAWPLRATVAANPLSGLEMVHFDDALEMAEVAHGQPVRPSLQWFLDLHETGAIEEQAIGVATAAESARSEVNLGTVDLLAATHAALARAQTERPPLRTRHFDTAGTMTGRRWDQHAHLWSARAWHRADDEAADTRGPWHLWRQSASHPIYDLVAGCRGASRFVNSLPQDPTPALVELLTRRQQRANGAFDPVEALDAVVPALMSAPGWVAHAQWRARRAGNPNPLIELTALRLALREMAGEAEHIETATLRPAGAQREPEIAMLQRVWQHALDITTRDRLCAGLDPRSHDTMEAVDPHDTLWRSEHPAKELIPISQPAGQPVSQLASQSVWCIDVRSERFRRHLERTGPHETFGFAGFFGIGARVAQPDGTEFDQCPVIVTPSIKVNVCGRDQQLLGALVRVATRVTSRPGAAFGVADAGGGAAFAAAMSATISPRRWRTLLDAVVGNPRRAPARIDVRDAANPDCELTLAQRTDLAESFLRTIGLTERFASVLLLCAHGSTTENNAFATAYDCGACGGNAGVINAAVMAETLNASSVRRELSKRGIDVPDTTRVLAAIHDTTTDDVDLWTATQADVSAAAALRTALEAAGRSARAERLRALPQDGPRALSRDARQRSANWSEPMPEWGLAGCSAIVVGPRRLTRRADLGGRVFLHSYEPEQDPDGAVLTQILTAPVVVSQWIAAQYWFSAVAPKRLGAGDKTTHNVVGDVGVLSGAHGDLRVGLPWQALFGRDPESQPDSRHAPAHVPSRHLVVVAGDPDAILRTICGSQTLTRLVINEWMSVIAVADESLLKLDVTLTWEPVASAVTSQLTAHDGIESVDATAVIAQSRR